MDSPKNKKKISSSSTPLIVGIGASAGGVEALQSLLPALQALKNISLVVLMHVDPSANKLISEVLSSFTSLPVSDIADGTVPKAGCVYTVPGHHTVNFKDGAFVLVALETPEERRNPIDRFFNALAREYKDRSIGVVLSGYGSDGTAGVKAISKAEGMTLAQAPTTAQHPEMPQNAIDSGAVDHVLSPEALAEELLAYAEHMRITCDKEHFESLRAQVGDRLAVICDLLLKVTGHNFRHYKTSTLSRRIQRRIQVLRLDSVEDYVTRLRKDDNEVRHLFNDLLIGVTAFFRDAESFAVLSREVFPKLFKDKGPEDAVRIWVPGCATGEEAYTLAILLREYTDGMETPPEIQIFATDIDEEALATARQAIYPLNIADEVTQERLKRFFIKKAQSYHVSKEIRSLILFSSHNLINDPPFSKLDLISCRNLLIYLGSHLQKKLIPLFHYALKRGGFLFLGPSENISSHRELFRPIDAKHRISQRLPTAVRTETILSGRTGTPSTVRPPNVPTASETDTYLLMQRIILDEFAPKALVVDEDGQIICASGNLEKYMTVSAGAFHNSAIRLVREGLRVGLRTTLAEAVRVRRQIVNDNLTLRTSDGIERVMLTVQPMPHMGDDSGIFLVVFQDLGRLVKGDALPKITTEDAATLIDQLEKELLNTREDLERTVQDLEAVNEEIKSSNEELLSMNEELQSANEELETSKEEVQAANDNLSRVNSDLENLLTSTQIATLFLDDQGNVRRATPTISVIYNIIPSDMGRPLGHFTHKARSMPQLPAIIEVYASEKPIEHEVELLDGSWYIRRILPYQNQYGEREGTVVLFTEVSERKRSELALRQSENRLRLALSAARLGEFVWHAADNLVVMSERAAEIFGVSTEKPSSRDALSQMIHPEDHDRSRQMINAALAEKHPFSVEYRIRRPGGEEVWVLATGRGEYDNQGKLSGIIGILKDITDKKTAEQRLMESERLYRGIGESIDYGVWMCDRHGKNLYASDSFLNLLGMTQEECSSLGWVNALHPDEQKATVAAWNECVAKGTAWDREHRFRGADGMWHPVLARGVPVRDEKGNITNWVGINLDIRRIKLTEARLRESEERFRTMADSAPVLIWISEPSKGYSWFNKPWLDFTGRRMEQEQGQGWIENIHPDDQRRYSYAYGNAFETQQPFRAEYRLRRHDGEYRWLLDNGIPIYDGENKFEGFIGSCIDITERKLAEEALKEADRRKDEFLATLAHELRNPLAPISNGLQVLRMGSAAKREIVQQTQEMMERQVMHMVRLVDDLLDVSRITRGQIELHRKPVEIASVIQSALEISRPLMDAKSHTLTISLPPQPLYTLGDATRLSQVTANVLNNAAKYTPEGGVIELIVGTKDNLLTLLVKDNGIGIPKDKQSIIFDVFVQVDTTLERAQGGLGIGLTLVRKLVELHGGSVEVASAGKGQGSEFLITLPLAPHNL